MPKRGVYTSLTLTKKVEVLREVEKGIKKKKVIAKEYGILPNTLSTYIKNKEKIMESWSLQVGGSRKRIRGGEFPQVDECVLKWFKQSRDYNIPVSGPLMRAKAEEFAQMMGVKNFKASCGWVSGFQNRNGISFKNVCGESASVKRETANEWINGLPEIKRVDSSAPLQSTRIRKREVLIAEMEKLLVRWLKEDDQRGEDLSYRTLQAKAKSLFEEVKQLRGEGSQEESFHASRGWYTRFLSRLDWQPSAEQESNVPPPPPPVIQNVLVTCDWQHSGEQESILPSPTPDIETAEEKPIEVKTEMIDIQDMLLPGPSSVDNFPEMYPPRPRLTEWAVPQQAPPGTKQVVPPTPPLKKSLPPASQPSPKPVIAKPPITRPVSPPQPPPPPPEVCLRWNSYHSNMQATFPSLLNNEQFVDVTLACEGRSIKCHKMMLSACSSYFEELLSQNPCQHPIVLMKDLKFWEVQALVDFMYRGEVNVGQDKLPSLLAAAEALQIKGLAGPASTCSSHDEDSLPPSLPLATDDYLDESASSPSSARRARKRRSLASMPTPQPQQAQQTTVVQPPRNPVGRPRLVRPSPQPSTSSYVASEPPLRRARRSEPTSLSVGEIKLEPVDIDISNDSIGNDSLDPIDDGFDVKKNFEDGGRSGGRNDSSRQADDTGGGGDHDMTGSICDDNSALLTGHDSDMDYGNNNGMTTDRTDTGTTNNPNTEIQGYSYADGSDDGGPGMSSTDINPSYPEVVLNPDTGSSDSILGHM